MNQKMWCFAKPGTYHLSKNISCEDIAECGEKNGMIYAALADGAGSRYMCLEGAKCAVTAAINYVSLNFERLITMDEEKAKYIISCDIQYRLHKNAGDRDFGQFASTLLLVGVKNSQCIIFHIGDGTILGIKNKMITKLSLPMNGENKYHTFFTTTTNVYKTARLIRCENHFDGFLLYSDGCKFEENTEFVGAVLNGKNVALEYIKKRMELDDDYSMAFIAVKCGEEK